MPEFEETSPSDNAENYAPSTDAKPRSRRRSGGFKKEQATAPTGNIGEIDPSEALRGDRLSSSPQPEAKPQRSREEYDSPRESSPARPESNSNPQPTEATQAAVERVEARIAKRRSEREARHQARKKERATQTSSSSKAQKKKGGLLSAILRLFGLGPKTPARKNDGRRGGRGGQNRGPRNGRSGGQGRGDSGGRRRGGRGRRPQNSGRRD